VFDKGQLMKFTVLQIQIADSVYDQVNRLGHEEAAHAFPEYRAYMDTMFKGSDGYKPEYSEFYKPVCTIEASNLNRVFDIGNIGPEESITRLAPMHSVSVGDIIQDPDGTQYMVDRMGFKELA
jgi:hypothetical protein